MHAGVEFLTADHVSNYFDITHSFKVDSFTYHVLGLRKDRPTYRNNYYIFNCPECAEERHDTFRTTPRSLPMIRTSKSVEHQSTSERRTTVKVHSSSTSQHHKTTSISDRRASSATPKKVVSDTIITKQTVAEMLKIEHRTLVTSIRNAIKTENETLLRSIKEKPKKNESETTTIEQKLSEILKTEHQTLITSLRTEMKTENETLFRSIKETLNENQSRTITIEQKLSEIIRSEHQTLVASFHREMKTENETLLRSIKEEKEVYIQKSTVSNIHREEIVHLLNEQKRSLEIIYEKQIQTIESSIERFIQTVRGLTNTQHDSSSTLDRSQLILVQTFEREIQQIISKNVEKFESTTLVISQLKTTLEQMIEKHATTTNTYDVDLLNRLFVGQRKFLTDTIEQQEKLWSERIKHIVHETLVELKSSSFIDTSINTTEIVTTDNHDNYPSEETTNYSLKVNQPSTNQTDQHLFKVSIKSQEPVRLYAKLFIGGVEYPRKSHTLCQRDPIHSDEVTCYVAPPCVDGPYEAIIYAKTDMETTYRAAISIRLPGANVTQSVFFPYTFPLFEIRQCILIQPLQSFVRNNDHVLIHMVIPNANIIKIRNGHDDIILKRNEYINGVVKKTVRVRGDIYVYGRWDDDIDSPICFFYVV